MNQDPLLLSIVDIIDEDVLAEQVALSSDIIIDRVTDDAKQVFDSAVTEITYKPATEVFKPDNSNEVINKRQAKSKTFQNPDGSFSVVIHKTNLHFNDNGEWKETNLLIRDVGGKKVMTNALYKIELFTDKIGYRLISEDGKTFTIELSRVNDIDVDYSNLSTKVEGNQVFYEGLFDNIHHKILLLSEKPEIYTKIDDETAPRKFEWLVTSIDNFEFTSKGGDNNQDSLELVIDKKVIDSTHFTYTETWTGNVSRKTDKKTRQKGLFSDPSYPIVIDPTVTLGITANIDDIFQDISTVSNTVNIITSGAASVGFRTSFHYHYYPGFRFRSVGVPAGATITSATLKIKSNATHIGTNLSSKVFADKVANAALWSSSSKPLQITKTIASTTFTPSAVNNAVNSIDVTAQIGEVIGLGGWASNNAIRLAALSVQHVAGIWRQGFIDYHASAANSASLIIVYTTSSPTVTPYHRNIYHR